MEIEQTQENQVLEHLGQYGSLTSWDAIQRYRITRLAEMIRRLRARGFEIESQWLRNGPKRYVRYYLSGDAQLGRLTERELMGA